MLTLETVMLNSLAPQCEQYFIEASDAMAGQTAHIDLSTLSNKRQETGGLHSVLKLAIGARVMLTTNVTGFAKTQHVARMRKSRNARF